MIQTLERKCGRHDHNTSTCESHLAKLLWKSEIVANREPCQDVTYRKHNRAVAGIERVLLPARGEKVNLPVASENDSRARYHHHTVEDMTSDDLYCSRYNFDAKPTRKFAEPTNEGQALDRLGRSDGDGQIVPDVGQLRRHEEITAGAGRTFNVSGKNLEVARRITSTHVYLTKCYPHEYQPVSKSSQPALETAESKLATRAPEEPRISSTKIALPIGHSVMRRACACALVGSRGPPGYARRGDLREAAPPGLGLALVPNPTLSRDGRLPAVSLRTRRTGVGAARLPYPSCLRTHPMAQSRRCQWPVVTMTGEPKSCLTVTKIRRRICEARTAHEQKGRNGGSLNPAARFACSTLTHSDPPESARVGPACQTCSSSSATFTELRATVELRK